MGIVASASAQEVDGPDRTYVTEEEFNPDYEVNFKSGTVVPDEGLEDSVLQTDERYVWVLVQFQIEPTSDDIEYLNDSYGYLDAEEIDPNTRYARIRTQAADNLAGEDFVRSVSSIRPEWRIHPKLDSMTQTQSTVLVDVIAFERIDGSGMELEEKQPISPPHSTLATPLETYTGELTSSQIQNLKNDDRVMWIEERKESEVMNQEGRQIVGADMGQYERKIESVPGSSKKQEYTGSGVRVGVLDSGIDYSHQHFDFSNVVDSYDWADDDRRPDADTPCDHGIHVAGTVAGNGTDNRDGNTVRGVAPEATLVVSQIFDGNTTDPSESCDWQGDTQPNMFDEVKDDGADIIVNSYGADSEGEYKTSAKRTDKWARKHPDTLIIFANGNAGDQNYTNDKGMAKNVISVGAVRDGSNGRFTTNNSMRGITDDSSLNNLRRSNYIADGSARVRPEVYAPGVSTTSATFAPNYTEKSGTSMAAPHVGGVAAMLKEKKSSLSANAMRAHIVGTTAPPRHTPLGYRRGEIGNNLPSEGYGVVNANNALHENEYEDVQKHKSSSVKKIHEPARTVWGEDAIRDAENDEYTVTVPSGAEKLVATLTWPDPQGTPLGSKGANIMVNELSLSVDGPNDSETLDVPSNVHKIEIDDPDAGDWDIGVHAERVTMFTDQDYDLVYRVVTEEPELSLNTDEVVVPVESSSLSTDVEFNIDGTGAPVSGVYGRIEPRDGVSFCNSVGFNNTFTVGTLSQGYRHSEEFCFDVPRKAGEYNVTLHVGSNNAEKITKGSGTTVNNKTASDNVTIRVPEPNIKLEPYMRNVSRGDTTTYALVAENVSSGVGKINTLIDMWKPDIGNFLNANIQGSPVSESVTTDTSNSNITIEGDGMNTKDWGEVTLAIIEAQGAKVGMTNMTITATLEDESGNPYSVRKLPRDGLYGDVDPRNSLGLGRDSIDGILNVTVGPSESVDVTVDGGTATPGGTAQINVTGINIGSIEINNVPSDWTVVGSQNDGAFVTPDADGDAIADQGSVTWAWANDQSDADVSVTFEVPSDVTTPVDFPLAVEGTERNGTSATATTVVSVQDCPEAEVVCDYDAGGEIDLNDLQSGIEDFVQGSIDLSGLQNLIEAFVTS